MTKLAYVNDYQEAKRFFDEFNIPYEVITEGESKGRLLVNEIKPEGRSWLLAAEDRLRKSRLSVICDHSNEFLDRDGNVIITFSPYNISELPPHRPWLKMSDYSIYGHGTKTFVVLSSELEKEAEQKRQKKDLEQRIGEAEEKVLRAKRALDAAVEKLKDLLEEKDKLKKGTDGGRINLNHFDCTWEGTATWDAGSGHVTCNYHAEMTFRKKAAAICGPEIYDLKTKQPGFKERDLVAALKKSICIRLDDEFEDYCNEDDYYQPVVEDFEAEYYAREWAEERGLELISFNGSGFDEGYERKAGRRR